jgi:transposase, IS5 family
MRGGPRSTARASRAIRTTSASTSRTRSSVSGTRPTPASTFSQKLEQLLDETNTGKEVWADSAYRSAEIEARLAAKGLKSRIHRRGVRSRPLSQAQQAANTARSVRARVEHVFGHQENAMGRKIVRTIGIARARFKIGMMNLGYNMRRLVQLERVAAAPA